MYWRGRKQAKDLCNRRLRILYDLHCIDKFYPPAPIGEGSMPAHIVLDYAGAKALDIDLVKIRELPLTFKHHTLVAEYRIKAYRHGFSWGRREERLGPVVADIYYPEHRIAVEVDRGTEYLKTLRRKTENYNRLRGKVNRVIFVTSGSKNRIDYFCDRLQLPDAGCHVDDLDKLLSELKKIKNIV